MNIYIYIKTCWFYLIEIFDLSVIKFKQNVLINQLFLINAWF